MQSTNLPSKFLVPFATNDSARVEVPVTTSAVGRASQSLGFPPITGQPPEAGGQPPQLEDFNGALNQASRVAWWSMLGGLWAYDATFATDTNINGYPNGAVLASADRTSAWLSQTDNNTANPDTVGTNWAPAWAYGASALSGLTGGTQTLTPAQAMKRRVALGGALTSNLVVVVPAWVYNWTFVNNTTGAFTVTVKTASGSGAVVPQNGAPTPLLGDGTNVSAPANNVPAATTSTQAMQLGQAIGRLLNVQTFNASGTYTPTAGTTSIVVEVLGGGGGGAGAGVVANAATTISYGGGGGGGGYAKGRLTSGFTTATIVVGAGGAASSNTGNNGNASSFTATGGTLTGGGGAGGGAPAAASAFPVLLNSGAGGTGAGGNVYSSGGGQGAPCIINSTASAQGGGGGLSQYGAGARQVGINVDGLNSPSPGGGGSGGCANSTTVARAGGAGGAGIVVIWEYA